MTISRDLVLRHVSGVLRWRAWIASDRAHVDVIHTLPHGALSVTRMIVEQPTTESPAL